MDFLEKMIIQNISTKKLIPYENNPRNNDAAVQYVANSIREFGFKVPLVIDRNNVVVTGHTRLKAAELLGLEMVPCIKADDLSDEQVKAFRIADNSVSDVAEWDLDKLNIELEELTDFNMDDFALGELDLTIDTEGIEPDIEQELEDDDGYYGDERERTNRAYHLQEAAGLELSTDYWQMPIINNDNCIPEHLIGFNYAKTSTDTEAGIHFYIDDYQFERLWAYPEKYLDILIPYECILSPDFSLYMDMPRSMKVWNTYRSRFIGAYYQQHGIKVIPTISWAEAETYDFCFSGIPEGSIVSVSTVGVREDKAALAIWRADMDAMIKRIKPSHILVYGGALDYDYGKIKVTYFENEVTSAWKKRREEV